MATTTPPTDQRAGVRPISFVLDNGGSLGTPLTLPIRPEDLTRSEPSRVSVHQTLGRGVTGWVDDFGPGLGTCTIAGHTGWGAAGRPDGVEAFADLNDLVVHQFPAAKQAAIDVGMDPAAVQLLFVDMLDDFTWSVVVPQFILRRSKSRPLLYQYNITLQAVSTVIDNPLVLLPESGGFNVGIRSLEGAIGFLKRNAASIRGLITNAMVAANNFLGPIATTVRSFVGMAVDVFDTVMSVVGSARDAVSSVVGTVVGIGRDIAGVGVGIFRTFSAIKNLPAQIKAEISKIGSVFNEIMCIFKNSLKPSGFYENYDDLYGASNCSSTTGGRPASIYADRNSFDLIQSQRGPVGVSSSAMSSISTLSRSDPVLAPMPLPEMSRHLNNVVNGIVVVA